MDQDSPGSGDPLIAEQARRWQTQQRAPQRPSTRTSIFVILGIVAGFVGPMFAVFTLMGGAEAVIPITVGSCGFAGVLCAFGLQGTRGAIQVLVIPLMWVGLAVWAMISAVSDGMPMPDETGEAFVGFALFAVFILIIAASTEAGYLAGRLVARRIRP